MYYIGVSDRKRKRINKETDKHYVADPLIHSTSFIPNVCTKFQNSTSSSSGDIFDRKFEENFVRKKNGQIKDLISIMWLFSFYFTIQLINIKLCTKYQNPKSSIAENL